MIDRSGFELRRVLDAHGHAIIQDTQRLEAILRDRLGDSPREIFLLMAAQRDGIPQELSAQAGHDREGPLGDRLAHRFALDRAAACWAVHSWAHAMDLKPDQPITPPEMPVARTIRVGSSAQADYSSIHQALRHAAPYARLVLEPGVYAEPVELTKPITLEAAGPRDRTILESRSRHAVMVSAGPVLLRGLTILHREDRPGREGAGICILGGAAHIEDCTITSESLSNVFLQGSDAAATIRNCDLHDGRECGVLAREGAALHLAESRVFRNRLSGIHAHQARIHIAQCTVFDHDAAHGLMAREGSNCTVEQCSFSGNGLAAVFCDASHVVLQQTDVVHGRDSGIISQSRSTVIMENCRIAANARSGMCIASESTLLASSCTIEHHPDNGIVLADHADAELTRCTIGHNGLAGISLRNQASARILQCDIHDQSNNNGVTVENDSYLVMSECRVLGNGGAALELTGRSRARVSRSRLAGNRTYGVFAGGRSTGTIEDCDVAENALAEFQAEADCMLQRQQSSQGET